MSGWRNAPPKAGPMIEALRGLGYSTTTALADVIDNSIAAGASLVDVHFAWRGAQSRVSVLDNGVGMSEVDLDVAMRLGEKSPLHERAPGDLGRFGLGLKTASFSQCRALTVASVKGGVRSCLRWDLDEIASRSDGSWILLESPAEGASELIAERLAGRDSGTLVLWEKPDRMVTAGFTQQDFLDLIDRVELHLAMVFHRYISGAAPRLRICINGRGITPWDPFLAGHPATWSSPVERFVVDGAPVEAQGHVLPHRDRLTSAESESAGGPDGWTAQQGFYVYRNDRLILAGHWLGLGRGRRWTKEEAHRLARIRLDLTNASDADWKIDVLKSTALAPIAARERLARLSEDVRRRARRVFAQRGQPVRHAGAEPVAQAWRAERFSGGTRYRVDRTHPVVAAVVALAGKDDHLVEAMIRVLEETIPVQRIWLDTVESEETPRTGFGGAPPVEVDSVLGVLYRHMVTRQGLLPEQARKRLLSTEPFQSFPHLVELLPQTIEPPEGSQEQ